MNPQFGSGSNIIGDTSALRQVMQSQGVDPGILNQVSGAAPTAQPNMAKPPLPQGGGAPMPAQQATPQGTGLPMGSPEAQTIVKALGSRLGSLSKMGQ